MRNSIGIVPVFLIAACGDVGTALRIGCGFADVLLSESKLGQIVAAFDDDSSPATKVCRVVREEITPVPGEPSTVIGTGPIEIELPDGTIVSVFVESPKAN